MGYFRITHTLAVSSSTRKEVSHITPKIEEVKNE